MANFDETFDWVVVGSGAGSMSSGMLMRQAGKSVVVLEKTEFFGGTTAKSGGVMWIPNNQFMDPGEDSDEKAITYLDAVVGDESDAPGTSHEKRLTYVNEAPKMLDFIIANICPIGICQQTARFQLHPGLHSVNGRKNLVAGRYLQFKFRQAKCYP